MRGEGVIFNVWRRKIRNAEERPEVLIDEFYPVREDIVLGSISYPSWRDETWKNENG